MTADAANGRTTEDTARSVIAYLRVSTQSQGDSGLGLDAQRDTIDKAARYHGWTVTDTIEDTASAKSLDRPGIQRALELLEDGGPDTLVVAKLDRLARSALDFLQVMERAKEHGWDLVVLDIGGDTLDTSTAMGRFTATIMAAVAELERNMTSQRTKEALAQAKAHGTKLGPAGFGWKRLADGTVTPDKGQQKVIRRMVAMRGNGATLQTIADELNADGIPTSRGGSRWYPSSVSAVLKRIDR